MFIELENDEAAARTVKPAKRGNLRKAVRYGREDIKAELRGKRFFHPGKPFAVELRDISTRGAYLVSPYKLGLNAAFTLKISFDDGKIFHLDGRIVHKKPAQQGGYGFRFNEYSDALGDYLLDTQTELIFR